MWMCNTLKFHEITFAWLYLSNEYTAWQYKKKFDRKETRWKWQREYSKIKMYTEFYSFWMFPWNDTTCHCLSYKYQNRIKLHSKHCLFTWAFKLEEWKNKIIIQNNIRISVIFKKKNSERSSSPLDWCLMNFYRSSVHSFNDFIYCIHTNVAYTLCWN